MKNLNLNLKFSSDKDCKRSGYIKCISFYFTAKKGHVITKYFLVYNQVLSFNFTRLTTLLTGLLTSY